MKKLVGKNISTMRVYRHMTRNQLAQKVGIHHNMISAYEKGTSQPTLEVFINICKSLRCDPNTLIELEINDNLLGKLTKTERLPTHKKKMINSILDEFISYDEFQRRLNDLHDPNHRPEVE